MNGKTRGSRRLPLLVTLTMAALLAFTGVAWAQGTDDATGYRGSAKEKMQPPGSADASTSGYDEATGYRGTAKEKRPPKSTAGEQETTRQGTTGEQQGVTTPALTQPATPTNRALGAYIQDVWNDPPTYISTFNNMVGTPAHVIMYYQNWEQDAKKNFDPAKMDAAVNSGAMPMVTWASRDPTKGANQPTYSDKNIYLYKKFDDYITKWAQDAKAWGKPMYLRFDHEMNGTWFPWSPGVNGNTTTDWINAWRHVHDIFVQVGATNVIWVWSPYVDCGGCKALSKVYPGDSYVDWTALDGYNWGTTYGNTWMTAAQIFGTSYDQITKPKASGGIAPSKRFMIAEISSAEQGGDKAQWITNTFNTDIPNRLPLTQAVVWFSADKSQQGENDWRVNSSQASLDAYKAVAASPTWQGSLPTTP